RLPAPVRARPAVAPAFASAHHRTESIGFLMSYGHGGPDRVGLPGEVQYAAPAQRGELPPGGVIRTADGLSFRPGGIGVRFGALVVDGLAYGVVLGLVEVLAGLAFEGSPVIDA